MRSVHIYLLAHSQCDLYSVGIWNVLSMRGVQRPIHVLPMIQMTIGTWKGVILIDTFSIWDPILIVFGEMNLCSMYRLNQLTLNFSFSCFLCHPSLQAAPWGAMDTRHHGRWRAQVTNTPMGSSITQQPSIYWKISDSQTVGMGYNCSHWPFTECLMNREYVLHFDESSLWLISQWLLN
jgi:hypothetical protein